MLINPGRDFIERLFTVGFIEDFVVGIGNLGVIFIIALDMVVKIAALGFVDNIVFGGLQHQCGG